MATIAACIAKTCESATEDMKIFVDRVGAGESESVAVNVDIIVLDVAVAELEEVVIEVFRTCRSGEREKKYYQN